MAAPFVARLPMAGRVEVTRWVRGSTRTASVATGSGSRSKPRASRRDRSCFGKLSALTHTSGSGGTVVEYR
jgi:hypothetical protein